MQTSLLFVASGIHKLSPIAEAERLRHLRKGTYMSKTASVGLLPSSTLFGRLMASIDRLLTASSRIAIRNGDLPLFWASDANFAASGATGRGIAGEPLRSYSTNGPGFRGHFYVRRWLVCRHLRQISRFDHGDKNRLHRGISYTRIHPTLVPTSKSAPGDGHVQSATDSDAIWRKDGQRMHASASSCASQIHNWPKGADAAPVGPSYNSSLQRSAMRQSLRRDDQGCKKTRNV